MRVLYFSDGYTPHDYRFLAFLSTTDHEVFFLQRDGKRDTESRSLPAGIRAILPSSGSGRRSGGLLVSVRRFRKAVRELRPDLVHAGPVNGPAWIAALGGFQPLASMSWGSDLLQDARRGWGRWLARFVLSRSAVLLVDSEAGESQATDLGMASARVVRFPWGVDLDGFKPGEDGGIREELDWSEALVILSNRAWEPIYGVEIVLMGFLRAAQQDPRLRLMLLGSGSQAGSIERIIQASGMPDRVWRPGRIAYLDLPRYYRAADLYLSGSYSDGSSVSLLEAMACGLPAVVSDIPGNREWIRPGETGWRFRVGDPEDLASRLLEAVSAKDSWTAKGQACRQMAESKADWDRNAGKLLEAYELARQDALR